MSDQSNENREQGIEFGDLMTKIETLDFPVTNERVLDAYGDEELTLDEQTVTLRETLGPQEGVTYEDPESVKQAVFNMVGDEAVGRKDYTDRGGHPEEATQSEDQESF